MLREGRDPDEAHRVGNPWSSPFLFPVTQLQGISTRQINYFHSIFLNKKKAVKNQNKYFHIWLQRLKKVVLYWSPESILQRHLKGILSAAEQYLLMKLF